MRDSNENWMKLDKNSRKLAAKLALLRRKRKNKVGQHFALSGQTLDCWDTKKTKKVSRDERLRRNLNYKCGKSSQKGAWVGRRVSGQSEKREK